MIVKILKSVHSFPGVHYNTNKIDRNKGELLRVANFGPLQALSSLRPQDYINYLQLVSGLNTRVVKPQFHAVISAKGKSYNKDELLEVAETWLKEMGYGSQPYLVIYHKDTDNNHVHLVTTRVGKDGLKINSAYENIRSVKSLNKVLGYDFGMQYRFSTAAQFYMVLESQGYLGKDFNREKLQEKINGYTPDRIRTSELKVLFEKLKGHPDLVSLLREQYNIELILHSSEGKKPYGYTLIDHDHLLVLKGSEVMPLRVLLPELGGNSFVKSGDSDIEQPAPIYIRPVWIADDIDDEAINGRNRRRKKKARTNTR